MLCPKLYQCYAGKGDTVQLNVGGRASAAPRADNENRHISGLGNVSHIDVARLSTATGAPSDARRRLSDESMNTAGSKRPSTVVSAESLTVGEMPAED